MTYHDDHAAAQKNSDVKVHLLGTFHEGLLAPSPLTVSPSPPDTASKLLRCSQCGLQTFQSRNALFQHIRGSHSSLAPLTPAAAKTQGRINDDLLERVRGFFREAIPAASSIPYLVPVSHLVVDRKVKAALRLHLQSLSMAMLPAEKRFEFETPAWWECASLHLLLALRNSSDFEVHNYDFASFSESLDAHTLLKDVMVKHNAADDGNSVGKTQGKEKHNRSVVASCRENPKEESGEEGRELAIRFEELVVLRQTAGMVFIDKPEGVRMESLVACCNWNFSRLQHQSETEPDLAEERKFCPTTSAAEPPPHRQPYTIDSVSRLDQPTSGVVVLPLSLSCQHLLTHKFSSREASKVYVCLVLGDARACSASAGASTDLLCSGEVHVKLRHVQGRMKTFVHPMGKPSSTKFCCVHVFENDQRGGGGGGSAEAGPVKVAVHSLVVCKPLTGRTHQIRAHMAHLGLPLLGDTKYDRRQARRRADPVTQQLSAQCPRLMLHSHLLTLHFASPSEQEECGASAALVTVVAPPPHSLLHACCLLDRAHRGSADVRDSSGSPGPLDISYFSGRIAAGVQHLEHVSSSS